MRSRDLTISFVRLCSMFAIIVCHILQFGGGELAYWFNVGVQVFLIISGYLYGGKNIRIFKFYSKIFRRIYLDYLLFLLMVVPVFLCYASIEITWRQIVLLVLGLPSGIPGLGHLWFISTILLCYLITPLLGWLLDNYKHEYCIIGIILCLVEGILHFSSYFVGAWINCYILGFALSRKKLLSKDEYKAQKIICSVTTVTIILNCIKVYMKYFYPEELSRIVTSLLGVFYEYCHVLLGLTIFLLSIRYIRNEKVLLWLEPALKWSDTFSYDVYLVHHIFILGPFSILKYNSAIMPLIATAVSLISGVLLKYIVNRIEIVGRFICLKIK